MKTLFQTGIRQFEIRELPIPEIAEDEALLRVKAVGICGSDIHYWNEGRIGDQVVRYPFILGHECAGIVEAVGGNVKGLRPGMKAAFEPGLFCEVCEMCRSGRYNVCPNVRFLGSPPENGAFREYLVGKERQILPLPDACSLEEGALLEPFSVGVYSVRFSGFRVADSAAVIGAGPIGLSTLAALKVAGAGKLLAIEKQAYRLDFSRALNADAYIDADRSDPVQQVREFTNGKGVDFVFEAAGSPAAFGQSVEMVKPGGTVILTGICADDHISMPMHIARRKEAEIKLIRREAFGYKPALLIVQKKLAVISHWVTHRYSMNEAQQAFETVQGYKDGVIKAMLLL